MSSGQVQIIGWARLELGDEVQVEAPCLSGFGVHDKPPTPDIPQQLQKPRKCVLEKSGPATAFMVQVDAEPSKQRNRLRVPTRSLPKTLGRVWAAPEPLTGIIEEMVSPISRP